MTRKQLDAAIDFAVKAHHAAVAAEESVYARVGDECQEWRDANALVLSTMKAIGEAEAQRDRKFPPPRGRIGDRGCGKSR